MKVFGIITVALLPLGIIALLASLASNRTADVQRRADLHVAVSESARKMAGEISADVAALTIAANAPASETVAACARLDAVLRARATIRPLFALYGPDRKQACASDGYRITLPAPSLIVTDPNVVFNDNNLIVIVPQRDGRGVAVASYSAATLLDFIRPVSVSENARVAVTDAGKELTLTESSGDVIGSVETHAVPLGLFGLTLTMSIPAAPMSAIEWLGAFLPLLMWASAAIIGFLVIDRLVIRPLAQLRQAVAGFAPGSGSIMGTIRTPAREIRELAETFETVRTTIATHEASLASALDDQVRLTREVHHRVKNNLQVVASLISLHARGAPVGPVADAYASIQRRVDALSIVHRNHYAERDSHGGICAKALIGEVATNLRSGLTLPPPPITVHSSHERFSQDVAVPVAFLITELVEVSITMDRHAPVAITLTTGNEAGSATMTVTSTALDTMGRAGAVTLARHGRIMEALARQLRAPLTHDADVGGYVITVPVLHLGGVA
jgi:two-component system, sensor histidine kinase PdtaS